MELRGVIVVEDDIRDEAAGLERIVPAVEPVANRPIAHHVLDALEGAGVSEVIVASSARSAPAVRDCLRVREQRGETRLRYVEQAGPLAFAEAPGLVEPLVGEGACILHAAAGVLGEPLAPLANCLADGSDAVITVHHARTPDQRLGRVASRLLRLAELDPGRSALGVADVLAFGPGAIQRAASNGASETDHAPGTEADVPGLVQRLTAAGGSLQVRVADIWRSYRGDAADLLELNQIVLDRIESAFPPGGLDTNRIEGRVRIHRQATVQDSVVVGPAVIGAGARISDAYIGPYTAIGPGARVEGAEIERSIISPGASIMHVGCRLTASVVGRDSRIFRDFSLPRAVRVRVGEGNEVALC